MKKLNWMNRLKSGLRSVLAAAALFVLATPAHAEGWADSVFATGTENLLADLNAWLIVLCPVVGGLMALYFVIRKNMATEETDGIRWKKLAIGSAIGGIAGTLITSLIAVVSGYFA